MRRNWSLRIFLGAVLLAGVSYVHAQTDAPTNYVAQCQACHGPTGAGETPTGKMLKVKSFNDSQVVSLTDASLTSAITNGSGKMPAYQNEFSNDQISNLVHYLHQLQTQLQGN